MRVDCHSHLGSLEDQKAAEFWRDNHRVPDWVATPYLEAMQSVDRAIMLAHWGPPSINSNDVVAHFTRENPKFVPFYNIDPRKPGVIGEIDRLLEEWGGKGIKLGPIYQGFEPDDEAYFPVYERKSRPSACRSCGIRGHRSTLASVRSSGQAPLDWIRSPGHSPTSR